MLIPIVISIQEHTSCLTSFVKIGIYKGFQKLNSINRDDFSHGLNKTSINVSILNYETLYFKISL